MANEFEEPEERHKSKLKLDLVSATLKNYQTGK